jgi:hypothetical protein
MQFYEKLNLLMNIFNITNSHLAKTLKIDPSLISRWRKGTRNPPNKSEYFLSIASFFVKQANSETKKNDILQLIEVNLGKNINPSSDPCDLLFNWFCEEPSDLESNYFDTFISNITNWGQNKPNLKPTFDNKVLENLDELLSYGSQQSIEVFHQSQGKRDALLRFLYTILLSEKNHEILLLSEDTMNWLTEDASYVPKLTKLIICILSKGHSIKIIHTLNRTIPELLTAIETWLPLYLTGKIKSYYLPKYKVGIFKHTVFVVPDLISLTSTCVSSTEETIHSYLSLDKGTVSSVTTNYNNFLAQCKPLIEIFSEQTVDEYYTTVLKFGQKNEKCITLTNIFSSSTMPNELLNKILSRFSIDTIVKEKILRLHNIRLNTFESYLKSNTYTKIVSVEYLDTLISNLENNFIPLEGFANIDINYTKEELTTHIENIINLLKTYPNFNLYISSTSNNIKENNISIYVKADSGVLVTNHRTSERPFVAAYLNENNLSNVFSNYLNNLSEKIPKNQKEKDYVIALLTQYLNILKKEPYS